MMAFLKIAWPIIQSIANGQLRHLCTLGGGLAAAYGVSAGYTPLQISGALFCIGSMALSAINELVKHGQIAAAKAETPPGYVLTNSPAPGQVVMAPIPNPQ